MPWIKKVDRVRHEYGLRHLMPTLTEKNIGDVTYTLYEIPTRIFARTRSWTTACLLLGAMVGAMACFFMGHVWPYEMEKQRENGFTDGDDMMVQKITEETRKRYE